MTNVVRGRTFASAVISTIGISSLIVHLYHFTEEDALSQIITGVLPPAMVSVGLIGMAVALYRSDLDTRYHLRVLAWVIAGGIGLAALGFALLLYQLSHGASAEDVAFIEVNWAATGSAVGFLIGYYNANLVRVKDELATEHNRLRRRETMLERENKRQERLVHIVSHDLRNPLTVARGHLDLIEETGDTTRMAEVRSAIDRMEEIISDILSMARDGRPVQEIETQRVRLGALARESWKMVETGDATLTIGGDCTVEADESRILQLFENLFRNAVEHGGEGVSVWTGRLTDGDGFFVEDDGAGLDGETPIFEAGFTTAESGTGLGLSIVRDIASAHGWEVRTAESERGGARFEIHGVPLES